MQVVFLFDLNAFNFVLSKSATELQRELLCLRLSCLRILTHYSVLVPNLKWGFKFFDSRGSFTQTMHNFSFPNVSLENFEFLENEICIKYQRHVSYLEALAAASNRNVTSSTEESSNCNQINKPPYPVQLLHLALTQILYEYQWNDCIDMFSPSTRKRTKKNSRKRNMLFFISNCASNNVQFQTYFGADCATMTVSKFTKLLLSQSLNEQLLQKASISWIWLNTSESNSFLEDSMPVCLTLVANTLKSLQCALIPLYVLSEPNYILKLKRNHKDQQSDTLQSAVSCNSLIPFSSSLYQSILYPFYSDRQSPFDEAEICFLQNDVTLPVSVTLVPLQWKGINSVQEVSMSQKETRSTDIKLDNNQNISTVWSKFTVQFAIARHVQLKTENILLLLPSVSTELSSYQNLRDLIKSLMLKNINLFVVCESVCGLTMPAIFAPLSDSSAVISILNQKAFLLDKTIFANSIMKCSETFEFSDMKKKLASALQSIQIIENNEMEPPEVSLNSETNLKPFQMECMETWFEPTSAVSSILCEIQHQKCVPEINAFHDKLRLLYKQRKKPQTEASEVVQKTLPTYIEEPEDIEELYKDISYEELVLILTDTYDTALKSNGNVLYSAKKIIKLASSFFVKKSIISYEENMKSFMAEFFCLTSKKVIEKYKSNLDEDAALKKINECQLQAILALEMEALFPSTDGLNCADNVRSFLGVLSFNSSSSDHNKFLCEVLKENYSHNLYDILLEIGDELMMPEEDSLENASEDLLSGSMNDLFNSVVSSTLSIKSSSSSSSKGDNRKLIRKRSDITDTNKSRQVLLPGKSPKRKKGKTMAVEKNAIRYSPRLASKKKREKFKTVDCKTETVRRNLFPRDRKPHTPRTSSFRTPRKKKSHTPKNHHVLKTNFVPETPSYKQNLSALQRRKSQMDISSPSLEVAESPSISKISKGASALNRLQKLKQNKVSESTKEANSDTASYKSQYTPESKRRLSLKLFSKVLTSPTARMGLKKCSKRLFDQISSRVSTEPSKKIKLGDDYESENESENSTLSPSRKRDSSPS